MNNVCKNVKVVIGANFGDEGKGLMTDYFCSKAKGRVLNVRFNGGAQAGHTVVKDGKRHVFHHFGSGSFNENCDTYLSQDFIVNPLLFDKEIIELQKLNVNINKVYINKNAIVTFPCDMMINQFAETHRNENKHGSCGVGIFETIVRNRDHKVVTIGDIARDTSSIKDIIMDILDNYIKERLSFLNLKLSKTEEDFLYNSYIIDNYIEDFKYMMTKIDIVDDSIINEYDDVVFEGAQGLLLDCNNVEYYPHLTPSSTGMKNVCRILKNTQDYDLEICYVTRSYFTRHGAGLLKTECKSVDINSKGLVDKTNFLNEFQGNFRYGYFDKETLKSAINNDLGFVNEKCRVSLAVTHLDETEDSIIERDKKTSLKELEEYLNIDIRYGSYGENTCDVREL